MPASTDLIELYATIIPAKGNLPACQEAIPSHPQIQDRPELCNWVRDIHLHAQCGGKSHSGLLRLLLELHFSILRVERHVVKGRNRLEIVGCKMSRQLRRLVFRAYCQLSRYRSLFEPQ